MVRRLFWCSLFFLALPSCDDKTPTGSDTTTTTTTVPPSSNGSSRLRFAQLSHDGRTVDLVLNGQAVATAVAYRSISPYVDVAPGEYRVQFFAARDRAHVLVETTLTLQTGQTVTVALGGLSTFETFVIGDDLATRSDRARVKLVNAVPDFPAAFDLAVRNGPPLFDSAAYFQPTPPDELIPGLYDLVLNRAGSTEEAAEANGQTFSPGTVYTLFVVGTLRRNDIEILAVTDAR